ncbi:MAG: RNA methyltransferase [Acidobacteriota bacterium]
MIVTPVLVRPHYAGNVGSAARVSANFGATRLVLVDPICDLEDESFVQMAMGAESVLEIVVVADLEAALADCDLAVATTSGRDRDPRGLLTPAQVRERAAAARTGRLGVVFGPERSGLTREELHRCALLCTIPSNPEFPVFNLAQAVAVLLASLADGGSDLATPEDPLDLPAPPTDFEAAMRQLQEVLLVTGFLDRVNPARTMLQIRRLIGRAVPTRRDIAVVRGLASHVEYLRRRGER